MLIAFMRGALITIVSLILAGGCAVSFLHLEAAKARQDLDSIELFGFILSVLVVAFAAFVAYAALEAVAAAKTRKR